MAYWKKVGNLIFGLIEASNEKLNTLLPAFEFPFVVASWFLIILIYIKLIVENNLLPMLSNHFQNFFTNTTPATIRIIPTILCRLISCFGKDSSPKCSTTIDEIICPAIKTTSILATPIFCGAILNVNILMTTIHPPIHIFQLVLDKVFEVILGLFENKITSPSRIDDNTNIPKVEATGLPRHLLSAPFEDAIIGRQKPIISVAIK